MKRITTKIGCSIAQIHTHLHASMSRLGSWQGKFLFLLSQRTNVHGAYGQGSKK